MNNFHQKSLKMLKNGRKLTQIKDNIVVNHQKLSKNLIKMGKKYKISTKNHWKMDENQLENLKKIVENYRKLGKKVTKMSKK